MTDADTKQMMKDIEEVSTASVVDNLLSGGACDFCSRPFDGHTSVWRTDDRVLVILNAELEDGSSESVVRDYGTAWAACEECSAVVELRDPKALVERVMPFAGTGDPLIDKEIAKDLYELYVGFFASGLQSDAIELKPRVSSKGAARDRVRLCMEEAVGLNHAREIKGDAMTSAEDLRVMRKIISLFTEAERLNDHWSLGLFDQRDREEMRMMQHAAARLVDARSAAARAERIEQARLSRVDAQPAEAPRCSECGKKPARVGSLCKRCAHASGLLPKGKIT